jgi:Glycosyl transferase family 2
VAGTVTQCAPRTTAVATAAQPVATGPVTLADVELSKPLPCLSGDGVAHVLVRLHARPLGVVEVRLRPGGVPPHCLAGIIRTALGGPIAAHLASHHEVLTAVLPVDGVAPATGCGPRPVAGLTATVVVTACASGPELERTLRGIAAQSVRPLDVLVVDNRPATSRIRGLVAALADPVFRYVPEPARGLSCARNAGLQRAHGDVVVFTDDDVVVDRDWLAWLLHGFHDERVACVTGLILPLELETQAQVWFEQFGGFSKGFEPRLFDLDEHRPDNPLYPFAPGMYGSGANSAFRTDWFREVGGFDENLGTGTPARGGEDLDAFLTVVQSGSMLAYEPAAILRHAHHRHYADLRRQIYGYGVGLGAMITKRLTAGTGEGRQLLRHAPAGLRHLLDPKSSKNAAKSAAAATGYPRNLTAIELAGFARGPASYWTSRRTAASRRQR